MIRHHHHYQCRSSSGNLFNGTFEIPDRGRCAEYRIWWSGPPTAGDLAEGVRFKEMIFADLSRIAGRQLTFEDDMFIPAGVH